MLKKILFSLIAIIIILLLSNLIPHSTNSTEIGIKINKLGLFSKKGVENKIYPPGATYFFSPLTTDWKTFDVKLQQLEMTKNVSSGSYRGRDDLVFKTIDGNDISLDMIISYRIIRDSAPYIVQYVATNDLILRELIVRTIVRALPRDVFGELTTEEFYLAQFRDAKSIDVRNNLNKILNPLGVIVERVGTKDYRFNPKYQQAIEQKKIAEQKKRQNESATKAAIEEWGKKLNDAQGTYNQMKEKIDGKYRENVLNADAYFAKQKNIAAAIIAEGKAAAEAIKKKREALVGSGGKTMVKLEYAKILKDKRILLLPLSSGDKNGFDIKTTDVNKLIEMYGVKSFSK